MLNQKGNISFGSVCNPGRVRKASPSRTEPSLRRESSEDHRVCIMGTNTEQDVTEPQPHPGGERLGGPRRGQPPAKGQLEGQKGAHLESEDLGPSADYVR